MDRRSALKATMLGAMTAAAGCSDGKASGEAGRSPAPARPRPTGPADWAALQQGLDGTLVRPSDASDYAGKSHVAYKPLPDDAVNALLDRFAQGNDVRDRSLSMDAMGGAIARVGPGDTAFPHRKGLFVVQYLAPDNAWLRATHAAMEPYMGGAAYVNYIDPDLKDRARLLRTQR